MDTLFSLSFVFFFSSRRRHTRFKCDWSSDVCSSDLCESDACVIRLEGGRGKLIGAGVQRQGGGGEAVKLPSIRRAFATMVVRYTLHLVQTRFEIVEHPADIGFRAWGRTREELFENAALALFSLGCELAAVEEKETRTIQVTGADLETLLYAWLGALLAVSGGDGSLLWGGVVG